MSNQFTGSFLPLAKKVSANIVSSNLVSVQPMTHPNLPKWHVTFDADYTQKMYKLDEKQKSFIDKLILLVNSSWYEAKHSPTAYKIKSRKGIVVIQNHIVIARLESIKKTEKYDETDRALLKKLRQKYKRYKRHLKSLAELEVEKNKPLPF